MPQIDEPKAPQQGKRKLSYQPHKLTAAERKRIELDFNSKIEALTSKLAALQADNIRLKNRGMLLERQLAIQDDLLREACSEVVVRVVCCTTQTTLLSPRCLTPVRRCRVRSLLDHSQLSTASH